jgi:hypothetical protein
MKKIYPKIGVLDSKRCQFVKKLDHPRLVLRENAEFCRKLAKVAINRDHNIDLGYLTRYGYFSVIKRIFFDCVGMHM